MRKATTLLLVLIVLTGLLVIYTSNVKAQSTSIYINADGEIVGTNNIQRNGDLYVLTSNISGGILIQKSNIILDGAGYTLEGYGGTGIDLTNNLTSYPSPDEIRNVTIKNLSILNFNWSINGHGSSYNTLYNDYVGSTSKDTQSDVILYWNRGGYNITHCTITGIVGIELSSGNIISENNLLGGILLQVVGNETIDSNFWSDYLTRYPNATELDSSGIGNTPYKIGIYTNGVVTGTLQDSHPLMKPISIPNFGIPQLSSSPTINPSPTSSPSPTPFPTPASTQNQSPSPSLSPSSSIPEFPTSIILLMVTGTILLVVTLMKTKRSKENKT